jgi:hypothetical protein
MSYQFTQRVTLPAAAACIMAAAPAGAQDLQSVRREIQEMRQLYDSRLAQMKADYETRIKDMEQRLKSAEDATAVATDKAVAAQQTAAQAAQAGPADAAIGTSKNSDNAFNPAISAVLDGKFGVFSTNPNTYKIPGFMLGDETSPGKRGIALGESEIGLSANVDQALYGNVTLSFSSENTVSVEEAFLQTTALPYGLKVKAGRFFSDIGYLNNQHAHTWDFADTALPYRAMLNTQYDDDGVQLKWVAPTTTFVEIGSEVFRGDAFPAAGAKNAGLGSYTAFTHVGGDINDSSSYRTGLSWLHTEARNRINGPDTFTGRDNLFILDGVYKWAPDGNPVERNLKLQGEFFYRREAGDLNGMTFGGDHQLGWYAQAVYQFMPDWRVGVRYDGVSASQLNSSFAGTVLDSRGTTPQRESIMADYSTSEFGRFRLQYNHDESRPKTDHQALLQYTISLGAHGAHSY